ncbi:MAG: hypothetical protein OXG56_01175 [Gammaproteobacteria bacterium]|nr:hypothetical protein [Gammaproteobacteria bacterium]
MNEPDPPTAAEPQARTIRAGIHPRALRRVTRMFAAIADLFTEALQNARRAGASTSTPDPLLEHKAFLDGAVHTEPWRELVFCLIGMTDFFLANLGDPYKKFQCSMKISPTLADDLPF